MTAPTTGRLDVKRSAAALRDQLRRSWPGVRFSVRMARGSAHGWLRVTWQDGPTETQVRRIAGAFQSSRFSGMDDAYHDTGVTRYSCRGITTSRQRSHAATEALVDRINAEDPSCGARAEDGVVRGGDVSPAAAAGLGVVNPYDRDGESPVPVDLVAHQIFARTPMPLST